MKKLNLHSFIVFLSHDETDNSLVYKYRWLKRSPIFDTKKESQFLFFSWFQSKSFTDTWPMSVHNLSTSSCFCPIYRQVEHEYHIRCYRLFSHRRWTSIPSFILPSVVVIQICQIRELAWKPPRWLLIGAIMEFYANKLSWLTVTLQWLGPTLVTWPAGASSLAGAIMRKLSFTIELENDTYRFISVFIGQFSRVMFVLDYRVPSNCMSWWL